MEDPQEMTDYAADIFAIRLLAPACLLHELGVDTPEGIMALCGLPPKAAALRAERMKLLNQRNAFSPIRWNGRSGTLSALICCPG